MYEIDLLRGSGIPKRTTLGGITAAMLCVLIPCLFITAGVYKYLQDNTALGILETRIANKQEEIQSYSQALEHNKDLAKDRDAILNKLKEVSSRIDNYNQWSGILLTLVDNIPEDMVLTALTADRNDKRAILQKENSTDKSFIIIPSRNLIISLSGQPGQDYYTEMIELKEILEKSETLGPLLETIEISREPGYQDGLEVESYRIKCVFKTEV